MAQSALAIPQVRMILRIYWTDQFIRRRQGYETGTYGLRRRLALQFRVSEETIKNITAIRSKNRTRYKAIDFQSLRRKVKARIARNYGEIEHVDIGREDDDRSRS